MADQHDRVDAAAHPHPPVTPGPLSSGRASRAEFAPVGEGERHASIDALRGLALLGILAVNIPLGFALHSSVMYNPTLGVMPGGSFEGADKAAWYAVHTLFELKMMTLFSMLFGAGLVLMDHRAGRAGGSAVKVYYKRLAWLALFGLVHAYALWYGDILFTYAVCGLLLYPMRRLTPTILYLIAGVLLTIGALIYVGFGAALSMDTSGKFSAFMAPSPDEFASEVDARRGSYFDYFTWNAMYSLMMQLFIVPFFAVWRVFAVMLIGMALMRSGVLGGFRSVRTYVLMTIVGFGVGVPLVLAGASHAASTDFKPTAVFGVWSTLNYIGSLFMAAGYTGAVMLVCKLGVLTFVTTPLAAVGRLALTNYLMQTVICVFVFTGFGLDQFNQMSRVELLGVTVGIWGVQIIFSLLWLKKFRMGPMEWVWRSLTYMTPQRILRRTGEATVPA
jgi:uncharacterized protein